MSLSPFVKYTRFVNIMSNTVNVAGRNDHCGDNRQHVSTRTVTVTINDNDIWRQSDLTQGHTQRSLTIVEENRHKWQHGKRQMICVQVMNENSIMVKIDRLNDKCNRSKRK
jgi:hypothetical protein